MRQLPGLSVSVGGLPQQGKRGEFPLSGLDSKWDTQAQDLVLKVIGYFYLNRLKALLSPKDPSALAALSSTGLI